VRLEGTGRRQISSYQTACTSCTHYRRFIKQFTQYLGFLHYGDEYKVINLVVYDAGLPVWETNGLKFRQWCTRLQTVSRRANPLLQTDRCVPTTNGDSNAFEYVLQ
jgi:hypothetical protein